MLPTDNRSNVANIQIFPDYPYPEGSSLYKMKCLFPITNPINNTVINANTSTTFLMPNNVKLIDLKTYISQSQNIPLEKLRIFTGISTKQIPDDTELFQERNNVVFVIAKLWR